MNAVVPLYSEAQVIITEEWKLLVEQMGIRKATQFVLLLERGKGDSIKEIADYWGNAPIDDIHNRVKTWKTQQ